MKVYKKDDSVIDNKRKYIFGRGKEKKYGHTERGVYRAHYSNEGKRRY
jgi:hypothetical protein